MVTRIILVALIFSNSLYCTLIVGVPAATGFVLCSDTRLIDSRTRQPVNDRMNKILVLNKNAVFAEFGNYTMFFNFNSFAAIDGYFKERPFSLRAETIGALAESLRSQSQMALSRSATTLQTPKNDNLLFSVVMLGIEMGTVTGWIITLRYIATTSTVTAQPSRLLPRMFDGTSPMILGETSVAGEVKDGHNKRFDDLRKDIRVMRFLVGKLSPRFVNETMAVEIAGTLITETGRRFRWLSSELSPVNEKYICQTLDFAEGVREPKLATKK